MQKLRYIFLLLVTYLILTPGLSLAVFKNDIDSGDIRYALTDYNSKKPFFYSGAILDRFYYERNYEPAWTTKRRKQLLRVIKDSVTHGLNPEDYHFRALQASQNKPVELDMLATDAYLTLADHLLNGKLDPVTITPTWTASIRSTDLSQYLENAIENNNVMDSLVDIAPKHEEYHALRKAMKRYLRLNNRKDLPRIDPGKALKLGSQGPRVAQLRARLEKEGFIATEVNQSPSLFDVNLENAVKEYQRSVHIKADGIVGSGTLRKFNQSYAYYIRKLKINLERWRWLPANLGERHIRVNIAGFNLELHENGKTQRIHDVIVGRVYRKTPIFSAEMEYFVLNPWWGTPHSIAVKDKLPLFQKDPSAVRRGGYVVYDRRGMEVDPDYIDWNWMDEESFDYRIRQRPGNSNALGKVKFMFPNEHNVYLHDTPSKHLFDKSKRTFSSGCIRVEHPMKLLEWVLKSKDGWNMNRARQVIDSGKNTHVHLDETIPVHVLYWTAVPDRKGGVKFVNDVYNRDEKVLKGLNSPPPIQHF